MLTSEWMRPEQKKLLRRILEFTEQRKSANNVNMQMNVDFIPMRLTQARKMAGLSLRALSEKLNNEPSHTMLNRYEKGTATPDSEMLARLACELHVAPDFFYHSSDVSLEGLHFRKRSKLSKAEREAIEENAKDYFSRYLEIEGIVNSALMFDAQFCVANEEDVEKAAMKLREQWNLGENPIPNLMLLLESKGVKIFTYETGNEAFDGCSALCSGVAMVVIASWLNKNLPRLRMTLAHELAHLVLQLPEDASEKQHEAFANAFASAFLMPAGPFSELFGNKRKSVLMRNLYAIKAYYGVSLPAIMMRARHLALVDESTLRRFFIRYNAEGYRKAEPGEYVGTESCNRFDRLITSAVVDGEVSMSRGASLWGKSLTALRRMVASMV